VRLIELKEKVRQTRIPNAIFHELVAVEADTVNADSPEAKQMLADEMSRATPGGNIFKVPLSRESKQYMVDRALPNLIDIHKDQLNRRLVMQLQKFRARLHAKLVGVEK